MIGLAIIIVALILLAGAAMLILLPSWPMGIELGLYRWISEHFGRTRAIVGLLILALAAFTFAMLEWKFWGVG
jgi:hypothetical protein